MSVLVTNAGNYPCVFGEIGIPFDMDGKEAYISGDYTNQIKAMDANMCALERNLLNFTLWNYCHDNNNTWGDRWNGEDLSLYCKPKTKVADGDWYSGARAAEAFVRPYPLFVPGEPLVVDFDLATVTFTAKFILAECNGPAVFEAYIPSLHFKKETTLIEVSDGTVEWDENIQRLCWTLGDPGEKVGSGQVSARNLVHVLVMRAIRTGKMIDEEDLEEQGICPTCILM